MAKFPGWRVVWGVALCLFASAGLGFYGLAVYLDAITRERGFSTGAVSGATALFFATSGVVGVLIARWIGRFDVRRILVSAALVSSVGLIAIGRVTEVWQVYVSYVVFAAGISGCNLIPATTVITRWFQTKRSVALAWASTGLSVGGLVMTPLASDLIDRWGLADASLALAAVFPIVVIPAALLLVLPDPGSVGWSPDGTEATSTPAPPTGVDSATAFRSWHFWALTFGFMLVLGSQVAAINHLVKLGSERIDRSTGALALSVLTIGSVSGRLVGGFLASRVRLTTMATVLMLTQGVAVALLAASDQQWSIVAAALLFGLTVGNVLMLRPLMIADSFGVKHFPQIVARTDLVSTFGVAAGPFLMGLLHDAFNYTTGYLVVSGLCLAGTAIIRSAGRAPTMEN
jgi:MFS family permease